MTDSLLVLNAGSSSVKFALYSVDNTDNLTRTLKGQIENIGGDARFIVGERSEAIPAQDHAAALAHLMAWLREQPALGRLLGVGHRVTHGGADYARAVLVDDEVLGDLRAIQSLAPLHQPHNLSGIDAVRQADAQLASVACFDTAFHVTQSELVSRFALPDAFYQKGIRRYGFHGLSYAYIAHYLAEHDPERHAGKVVVAHLGNGASLCAMEGGRCVETSMGFSALDGLCMGTRCGRMDPGVLLYLMQQENMGVEALENLLYRESGLLGLSNISNDMRTLLASGEPAAKLAVDYFVHQLNRELGALTATLGGIDTLVFTGGIGENSRPVRENLVASASWLGMAIDPDANQANRTLLSTPQSRVSVLMIPTNEERMIARDTLAVLRQAEAGDS